MTAIVIAIISLAFTCLTFLWSTYKSIVKESVSVIWKYDDLVIPLMEDISQSGNEVNNIDSACNAMGYIIQLYSSVSYSIASRHIVFKYLHIYLLKTWGTLSPYVNSLQRHPEFTELVREYKIVMKHLMGDVSREK